MFVNTCMHAPTNDQWIVIKRILQYLKHTHNHGLLICKSTSAQLTAFSDADWIGSSNDRWSFGGYAIYFGNKLISWASKTHRTISRSSTEVEYQTLANTTVEVKWLHFLTKELG